VALLDSDDEQKEAFKIIESVEDLLIYIVSKHEKL